VTISAALVLLAVIWTLCLFVALPLRLQSQAEAGEVVPGTPPSAPADPGLRRKLRWVTLIALGIWSVAVATILWSGLTVRDLDFLGNM